MMDRPQSHLSSSGGESASASSLPSSSQAADPLASAASSLSQTEPSADLTQTSVPELGAASGSHSVAQESSIRMYVESQDGSLTDDDTSELSVRDKVNRGTLTEREDSRRPKCKYCLQRLSKLRKLEKMKTLKSGESSSSHEHHIYSPMQPKKDKSCQTSASLFEKAEMTQKEMRSLAMILGFRDGKPSRTETFCKCVLHGKERDCRCGEEDKYFEWYWDIQNRGMATNIQERGRLVVFHKDYSCGTTAIRGTQPMEKDQHFWEIKMTTPVYGTDMMVGVGTSNVELNKFHNTFCSMLGYDMDSWGISYDGRVQHGGRKRDYCSRFGQGAIIGVHLDMWHGTLAFFKNRQCLGVAFRGLRGRTLYPMACSTAARSGMRVISSRSFPTSLQFLCCQRLRQFVPAHLSVLDTLAMPPGLRAFLANNMTWLLHVPTMSPPKPRTGYICHICMPLKGVLEGCTDDEVDSSDEDRIDHVHDMANLWNSDEDSDDDDDDSDDISDRTPSGTLPSRLMTSLLNSGSSASSDAGRAVVSHRSVFGVKKTRLEQDYSLPFVEEGESYTDDEEEEDESMKTAEESSSGPQRETENSELMVEEEEEDASGPKVFKKLGKRKRSN